MRRVLRRLASATAIASLLLCMTTAVLWVRSYWKSDCWGRFGYVVKSHLYHQQFIQSEKGRLAISDWGVVMDDRTVAHMDERAAKRDFDYQWKRIGWGIWWPEQHRWWENVALIRVQKNTKNAVAMGVGSGFNLVVPYWVLTLLFLVSPAMWSVRRWRTRRWRPGLCRNCGYDLRESRERCPECGRVV